MKQMPSLKNEAILKIFAWYILYILQNLAPPVYNITL